jgi:signal transduction histidine kinase
MSQGFIAELVRIKLAYADIFIQIGEFTRALEYQMTAYHLSDSARRIELISTTLNRQAQTYIELEDYDKAEETLKAALKHAKVHDQASTIAATYMIFGDLYAKAFNYQFALEHYRLAYDDYMVLGDEIQIAGALFNIGKCHAALDEEETAFQHHLKSLSIRSRIEDRTGLAESYNEIGRLCLAKGEYQRAINNLKLGLNNAELVNSNLLMQQSFDYLYQGYLKLEDYETALLYQNKYTGISELIYSEASERKIREIEIRNEIKSREAQIKSLEELKDKTEKELATSKKFVATLIVLLIVVLVSVVVFIRYYREKKKINDELQKKNAMVLEQNEKLKELNSTKDKFFTIIGHDLRGPLNSLTSFSSLLINHTSSLTEQEIKTIAIDLDKSLKNLYELLENLLGWARSQTNSIDFNRKNFKIAPVIKESIRILAKAALNKKIKLEMMVDEDVKVNADINSVKTIIRNIISNAIKFTNSEGVITIFVDELKDIVEIGVRDTGVGMSEEDQSRVFDISAKHTTMGTNREKGTGLGLILCKEFVEMNGGNISVESELGVGTTFKFTLQKEQVLEDQSVETVEA